MILQWTSGYMRLFNAQTDIHMLRNWDLDAGTSPYFNKHLLSLHLMLLQGLLTIQEAQGETDNTNEEKNDRVTFHKLLSLSHHASGDTSGILSQLFFHVFISVVDGGQLRDPNIANCHSE